MKENKNNIEIILGILTVYIYPNMFKCQIRKQLDFGENFDFEQTQKYYRMISTISWFLKKITKYDVYFAEFYPENSHIKNNEALEHHIHAYLEDLETLKHKFEVYLGSLKNDLQKITINKDEIVNVLKWLIEKINNTFKHVSDVRGSHRHKGYRFLDSDLVDVESCDLGLDNLIFKNMLTGDGVIHLTEKRNVSFEKAKVKWVNIAKKNNIEIKGMVNAVLEKTENFLYVCLDIFPSKLKKINNIK